MEFVENNNRNASNANGIALHPTRLNGRRSVAEVRRPSGNKLLRWRAPEASAGAPDGFRNSLLCAGLSLLTITIGTAAHTHVVRPRSRLITISRLASIGRVRRLRTVTHGSLGSRHVAIRVPETFGNIEFSISVPSHSIVNSFRTSSGGTVSFRFRPRRPAVFLSVFLSACRRQCPRRRHTYRTRPARFRSRLSSG